MMRTRRLFLILGCVAVLVVTAAVVWRLRPPKPLYQVTFLPSLGGVDTKFADGLNGATSTADDFPVAGAIGNS